MKKILFLAFTLLVMHYNLSAQYKTPADGSRLNWVKNYIEVYRALDNSTKIDLSHPKTWNHKNWFYLIKIDTIHNVEYVKIFIPDNDQGASYAVDSSWKVDLKEIGKSDYSTYLYIKKADFDQNEEDHFPKYTWDLYGPA